MSACKNCEAPTADEDGVCTECRRDPATNNCTMRNRHLSGINYPYVCHACIARPDSQDFARSDQRLLKPGGAPRIYDLFKNASKIIVTQETRHIHASWEEAIAAPALKPERPTTRHAASPQIMLRGPFKDDAELISVLFYVGIGFIEVRRLDAEHCTYETTVIGGDGIEEREAFMTAARDLFFSDVRFGSKIHA